MAVLERAVEGLTEGGAITGVAIGLGVLFLAPRLLPAVGRAIRPVAVGAIKTGMSAYNSASESMREITGDLVAEARAELEAEGRAAHAEEPAARRASRTAHAAG